MLTLLVTGKSGRMGQAVLEAAAAQAAVQVTHTHDAGEDLEAAIATVGCVIDFTIHSFTTPLVEAALKHGTRLVIGTTGHTDTEKSQIANRRSQIPMVWEIGRAHV